MNYLTITQQPLQNLKYFIVKGWTRVDKGWPNIND